MQNNNNSSATIRRVNRADAYLESLVEKRVLSEDGKNWLRLFLDPFHDTSINPQQYPDGCNTSSVAEIINLDFPVRKPTALAAGNWTCHIFMLPTLFGSTMSTSGIVTVPPGQNIPGWLPVTIADATAFPVNLLNIHAALDGANLGPFALSPATFVGALGVPATFKTGVREDALAYEVHNTTSKLQVSGMSTHYRCPTYSEVETVNLASGAGVSLNSSAMVYELPSPPGNTANALQMLGTLQWEARFGNYTVVPLTSVVNAPQAPSNVGYYFFDPTSNRYMANNVVSAGAFITPANFGFNDMVMSPIALCGSYYTGLSDITTLTVKLRIGIERFPSIQIPAEAELVRLCHMTPARDAFALEIASACIRKLPTSVVVSENAFGDWFIDVADKVLKGALPILKMFPHPIAQGLATVGSALQPALSDLNEKQQRAAAANAATKALNEQNRNRAVPNRARKPLPPTPTRKPVLRGNLKK
jgi:hypothetical protein